MNMKHCTKIITAVYMVMMGLVACKNDRVDDTRVDTSSAPAPNAAPAVTQTTTAKDSLGASIDSAANANATGTPEYKKAEAVNTRTRKTSRKGRIILATLNNHSAETIQADREGIYNRADIMPSYPGGEKELRRFIEKNIEYPRQALDNETEGTVRIEFAVDERGNIYRPMVTTPNLGNGLEEEALRVVKLMPKWSPGQINGKNVKTRFTLPITYQISDF
jgi:TonB family protein